MNNELEMRFEWYRQQDDAFIDELLDGMKERLHRGYRVDMHYAILMLGFALEGIKDKKDLYPTEKEDIKRIRDMIKGL